MDHLTEDQLHALAAMLRPTIAKILGEAVHDIAVTIVLAGAASDQPVEGVRLRFTVLVRGQAISPDAEDRLSQFLQGVRPSRPV